MSKRIKGYVTTKSTGRVLDSYTRRRSPNKEIYKNRFENKDLEGETSKIFNGAVIRVVCQIDPDTSKIAFYRPYLVNRAISLGCTEEIIREFQSMRTDNSFDEIVMDVDTFFVKDR